MSLPERYQRSGNAASAMLNIEDGDLGVPYNAGEPRHLALNITGQPTLQTPNAFCPGGWSGTGPSFTLPSDGPFVVGNGVLPAG